MEQQKPIKQIVYPNYDRFIKKFKNFGMSKDRASELAYHFWEIEGFCLDFKEEMNKILKSKNKKQISETLESIQDELGIHIIEHHLLPLRRLLRKEGFNYDIHPEIDYSMKTKKYDKFSVYENLEHLCKSWDNCIKNKRLDLEEMEKKKEKIISHLVKLKLKKEKATKSSDKSK